MNVDVSTVLHNLAGHPHLIRDGDAEVPLTLAIACVEALLDPCEDEITLAQKQRAFALAQRLYGAGEIDLDDADRGYLQHKIGAYYPPAIVGPAVALLGG